MKVSDAIETRRSVRGFTNTSVPQSTLREIFQRAQRAPSWCNIQPWRVWVTSGETTERLRQALVTAAQAGVMSPEFPWPSDYPEPYGTLRKSCGKTLYTAMEVPRGDAEGRMRAWLRNYEAFDAPHIAMVGVDTRLGAYGALDVGCWLSTLQLLMREHGLHSCAQASLATCPAAAREVLSIPKEVGVLFGISFGYEDTEVLANRCRTDRNALEENVQFC